MTRIATAFLALVVGLAPIALGSNRPLPWALNAMLAGLALALAAIAVSLERHRHPPLRLARLSVPILLAGLALLWGALQLVPLPGPLSHPVWEVASHALDAPVAAGVAVDRESSLWSLSRMATVLSIFLAACLLARDPQRARLLLAVLAACACGVALYGLARHSFAMPKILWFDQPLPDGLAATFMNRNHAASYFGLAAIATAGLLAHRARREWRATAGRPPGPRIGALASRPGLWTGLVALVLLVVCLLLTGSRAGIASSLAGLATLVALLVARRKGKPGWAGMASPAVAAVAGLALLLELSGGRLMDRLEAAGLASEGRMAVQAETVGALRDHALTGAGLGAFAALYPLYRGAPDPQRRIWQKAHNGYLELALGLGLPAAALLLAGLAWISLGCLRGALLRRRDAHFAMIAAAASMLCGLHALADFSLQVEAVAMTFAALLGAGHAQAASTREGA